MMKFTSGKAYYADTVYEFNLPAGYTCPYALACKSMAGRKTGALVVKGVGFVCYAALNERYPNVRDNRWANLDALKAGEPIVVPPDARLVRIHASGDFYSQDYFDLWLEVCRAHPGVKFWAFTKSIPFWLARRDAIPPNLSLVASYGGLCDELIEREGLRSAKVYSNLSAVPKGMLVDTDDSLAMDPGPSFALLKQTPSEVLRGRNAYFAKMRRRTP